MPGPPVPGPPKSQQGPGPSESNLLIYFSDDDDDDSPPPVPNPPKRQRTSPLNEASSSRPPKMTRRDKSYQKAKALNPSLTRFDYDLKLDRANEKRKMRQVRNNMKSMAEIWEAEKAEAERQEQISRRMALEQSDREKDEESLLNNLKNVVMGVGTMLGRVDSMMDRHRRHQEDDDDDDDDDVL